jgi:hypothetical protein
MRKPSLPPITAPPTLTAGTDLSGPSSHKSSLAPRPCVVNSEFPVAVPSTHQFLLTTVLPPVHLHPRAIASLLVQRGVLLMLPSSLCLASHYAARKPVATARQRGPRVACFAGRGASADSMPSRPRHSLPFACLGRVHWQACARRVAILSPPVQLTHANYVQTNALCIATRQGCCRYALLCVRAHPVALLP